MHKGNKLLLAISTTFLLVGCSGKGDPSSEASSTSSGISSSDVVTKDWSDDDKTLISKYCGELLLTLAVY